METKKAKKKPSQPVVLDEKLLADVSGGTAGTGAEVISTMQEKPEADVQEAMPLVGAIVVE